jgi:hypothetical protein
MFVNLLKVSVSHIGENMRGWPCHPSLANQLAPRTASLAIFAKILICAPAHFKSPPQRLAPRLRQTLDFSLCGCPATKSKWPQVVRVRLNHPPADRAASPALSRRQSPTTLPAAG